MDTETAIEKQEDKSPVVFGGKGLELQTLDDLWRFSQFVTKAGWAPKGMSTPESILVAIQAGAELGLTPMSALQNMAVINGRPGVYGDAALALVRASGLLESYSETFEGADKDLTAVVSSRRVGDSEPLVSRFSVEDAKRAQLWGKQGPWTQYPRRMLKWRARGFNLRDNFGDVLKGLSTVEEIRDIIDVTPIEEKRPGGDVLAEKLAEFTEEEPTPNEAAAKKGKKKQSDLL